MNDKDFNANKHFGASWGDQPEQVRRDPVKPDGETIETALDRMEATVSRARAVRERWELWAAGQPQTKACSKHPNRILKIDAAKSADKSFRETEAAAEDKFFLIYEACPECVIEMKVSSESHWLKRCGVPEILLHGSFKTWRIESDEDRINLSVAKAFVEKRRGLLLMTGNRGDGKSLLSVAIMREFLGGRFTTQNDLLIDLRRGYRDPKAIDVIRLCQEAKCLVVDDFGLSMGGADELPMLQAIFDHRHGEKLPTIVTSNLTIKGVYDLMGARLEDRFKQSLYRHLTFTGVSSRAAERANYFAD